jgi:hypothetical protein
MGIQKYDEQHAVNYVLVITHATGTSPNKIFESLAMEARVDHIFAASTALLAHDVILALGSTPTAIVAVVSVPAGAGQSSAVPVVDLLASLPTGMDGLAINQWDNLQASVLVALSTGETLTLWAFGGVF